MYVGMHVRTSLTQGQSEGRRKLNEAVRCARARLRAHNSTDLFVATM